MPPVTVSELISNFAAACRALIPALDAARVPWQDGKQYDNWERLEEALFKSLVSEPCEYEAREAGEVAKFSRYGFNAEDELANAMLVVRTNGDHQSWRYVQLATREQPFDAARCVRKGETKVVSLAEATFYFIITTAAGETVRADVRLDL